jgi:glyoxylase-like metal-dependent hydrolase (beta-lactamase superfamily II)
MRIHAARTFGFVEHGAHDVSWQRAFTLESGERGDARVYRGAHVGSERVEAFAEQLPFRAHEARHLGEAMTARVAATPARPPRALLGGGAGASFDVVVDGEESLSHDGGFVQLEIPRASRARTVHEDESMMSLAARSLVLAVLGATAVVGVACSPAASDGAVPAADPKPSGSETGSGTGAAPGGATSPTAGVDAGPSITDASTGPQTNGFPAKWIDGTACGTDPEIQTWKYSEDTFILRQSLCTTFEGPFMYLFVGTSKALLVDTGTGGVDLRGEVTKLLAGKNVQLVVAHSHSHGDHVNGDGAFKNQPNTTVVGLQPSVVKQFFGIVGDAPGAFDLGGRVVDVLAIPGHQAAHVAYYDHETKLLLSGDTLYPGRLYIDDWNAYRTSVPRLIAFVDAQRPVSFVLGGHIELPKTGPDFPFGTQLHPGEHALELGDQDLRELDTAVKAMGNTPKREVHATFIISP